MELRPRGAPSGTTAGICVLHPRAGFVVPCCSTTFGSIRVTTSTSSKVCRKPNCVQQPGRTKPRLSMQNSLRPGGARSIENAIPNGADPAGTRLRYPHCPRDFCFVKTRSLVGRAVLPAERFRAHRWRRAVPHLRDAPHLPLSLSVSAVINRPRDLLAAPKYEATDYRAGRSKTAAIASCAPYQLCAFAIKSGALGWPTFKSAHPSASLQ